VVFENSLSSWTTQGSALAEATRAYDRTKLALVVHSVPDLSVDQMLITLQQLLTVGHSLWLTSDSNYTMLDDHFEIFINCLATLLS
jgi:hypothetical protein